MTVKPLRFGLLVSGHAIRRWHAEVIRHLIEVDGVELALVVVDARQRSKGTRAARLKRISTSRTRLWDLYNNGWVGRAAECLSPVALENVVGDVQTMCVEVERKGWSEFFGDSDVAAIRDLDLDFLLRFGFGIIRGDILDAARLGVWSFHHDDEQVYRGSPPAFWEIVDDQDVSGVVLQRLTDRLDGGLILRRGWLRTVSHSYVRNTDQVHMGAVEWPAAVCRAIIAGDEQVAVGELSRSEAPIYHSPDDRRVVEFLFRQAFRQIEATLRGLLVADHWEVGLIGDPIHRFLEPGFRPHVEWLKLGSPRSHYAADPFGFDWTEGIDEDERNAENVGNGESGGYPRILFERFDRRRRTGEIWEKSLCSSEHPHKSTVGLNRHASYPFIIHDNGRTYCIPQQEGSPVHIHEVIADTWVDRGVIVDEEILDPTVVHHNGRWWMFGTRPGRFSLAHLSIWHASELMGPWAPHVANPVKTDVRGARPAGTPFFHEGRLYRPAQDCSTGYGARVAICEVTRLDELRFEEHVVNVVKPFPDWPYRAGVHTLSALGESTLVDARRPVFDRFEMLAEARGRLRRLRRVG